MKRPLIILSLAVGPVRFRTAQGVPHIRAGNLR
jgi:hypothetical protein